MVHSLVSIRTPDNSAVIDSILKSQTLGQLGFPEQMDEENDVEDSPPKLTSMHMLSSHFE